MNIFGNDPSINPSVFESCKADCRQKLSADNLKLNEKLTKYTEKETILEFAVKDEPGTELST